MQSLLYTRFSAYVFALVDSSKLIKATDCRIFYDFSLLFCELRSAAAKFKNMQMVLPLIVMHCLVLCKCGGWVGAVQIKFNPRNTIIWITSCSVMPCGHGVMMRGGHDPRGRTQRVLRHPTGRRFLLLLSFAFGEIRNARS